MTPFHNCDCSQANRHGIYAALNAIPLLPITPTVTLRPTEYLAAHIVTCHYCDKVLHSVDFGFAPPPYQECSTARPDSELLDFLAVLKSSTGPRDFREKCAELDKRNATTR